MSAGDAGYRRSVVEGVAQNHRVAHLNGNVEYQSADGRADKRAARAGVTARHAVANHLERVYGGSIFLACLVECLAHVVVLLGADELLVVELFLTVVVNLRLLQVYFRQPDAALCRTKLPHVGYNLNLGYHLAGLHHLARLLVDFGNDAADLRFHFHLVARFYRAGYDGRLADVGHFGCKLVVNYRLRLRLFIKKDERSYKNQDYNRRNDYFQILLHIYLFYLNSVYSYYLKHHVTLCRSRQAEHCLSVIRPSWRQLV